MAGGYGSIASYGKALLKKFAADDLAEDEECARELLNFSKKMLAGHTFKPLPSSNIGHAAFDVAFCETYDKSATLPFLAVDCKKLCRNSVARDIIKTFLTRIEAIDSDLGASEVFDVDQGVVQYLASASKRAAPVNHANAGPSHKRRKRSVNPRLHRRGSRQSQTIHTS